MHTVVLFLLSLASVQAECDCSGVCSGNCVGACDDTGECAECLDGECERARTHAALKSRRLVAGKYRAVLRLRILWLRVLTGRISLLEEGLHEALRRVLQERRLLALRAAVLAERGRWRVQGVRLVRRSVRQPRAVSQ